MQTLLSLPESLVDSFYKLKPSLTKDCYVASDPKDMRLGSGGGTVHLLESCFRNENGKDFKKWLSQDKRILLHAGGHGRRIPAYAPSGKILTPIPVFRSRRGQDINQDLLDLQLPLMSRIMEQAPDNVHTLVASGDVLITSLPGVIPVPTDADVVCYGLWVEPYTACHHGMFFMDRGGGGELDFMLQKPSVKQIESLALSHTCLMDIGIWLLSDKAVEVLQKRCHTRGGKFTEYDLYGTFGLAMGAHPTLDDDMVRDLKVKIQVLPGGAFYHFGTSHELVDSMLKIQTRDYDPEKQMSLRSKPHPSIFKQNCTCEADLDGNNHNIWIENSHITASWKLSSSHILTGIPYNQWGLELREGMCLDVVPLKNGSVALRPYGYTDTFSGDPKDPATRFLEGSFLDWARSRDLEKELPLQDCHDIQSLELFPVVESIYDLGRMAHFFLDETFEAAARSLYLSLPRLSADDLLDQADLEQLQASRKKFTAHSLKAIERNCMNSIFYQLDLDALSRTYHESGLLSPKKLPDDAPLMWRIHNCMMRSNMKSLDGQDSRREQKKAFDLLREGMLERVSDQKQDPHMSVLQDQIVWARSPVRIDLAGGWTDTPPYSLYQGGRVVNMAINLNRQTPIQVYVKPTQRPVVIIRSIDLGDTEMVRTYREMEECHRVGSPFSIPKAALILCGFLPGFSQRKFHTLEDQLKDFGCGMEITLFSAVPAGSGLGTSSILSATVLGALSDFCGLGWTQEQICDRTLILEQMLTTGGGWQDQYGGALSGVKLLETSGGFCQVPKVSWLPENLFHSAEYQPLHLLYYTGYTRTAKSILAEIVKGMFLNSGKHIRILEEMGVHALDMAQAIQTANFDQYGKLVNRTWTQNQMLDEGTNTPEVDRILRMVTPYCLGAKLPGAGGGGFLYMVAKDLEAASRIRRILTETPPNPRARFVEMELSPRGLQVSRN